MRNKIKYLLSLVAVTALMIGCQHGKLQTGGAYAPGTTSYTTNADSTISTNVVETAAPDLALFNLDAAFKLAYTAVNTAFELEQTNRQLLWGIDPEIKHTLDKIRPQAVDAVARYGKFRRIYLTNPTPAGLSTLQQVLADMQNFSTAAQGALPRKS